jgi:hypothetical protein
MYTRAVTITLAPDGRQLSVEYSEAPEPGAERFFHYVFSLQSRPTLITGHSPYSVDIEKEIDYNEIPSGIIHEVRSWLESNHLIAIGLQDTSLARILSQYLAQLNG